MRPEGNDVTVQNKTVQQVNVTIVGQVTVLSETV